MSEKQYIRAKTYTPVAHGPCPVCGTVAELRFVYNPYGHDVLACVACADHMNDWYLEHSRSQANTEMLWAEDRVKHPQGKTLGDMKDDINNVITEAFNGWPKHVQEQFRRDMGLDNDN